MEGLPERSTVEVEGRTAAYWRTRSAPPGAPRVLLVHGLGASNHIWEPMARSLPPAVELIALDLPGSGGSPAAGPLGPPELARFTLGFLDALGVARVEVAAGHSLGGAVALELGLAAPERLGGLMIFNAAPALPLWTRLSVRLPGVRTLMALPAFAPRGLPMPTRLFTQLYLLGIFGERSAVTAEAIEGYARLAATPEYFRNMAETLAGFARHTRTLAELERLRMPAAVVWGERDPVFPVSVAEKLVRAMPHTALNRLPRCGHCPPQEAPEVAASLLLELLSRVHRAGAGHGQARAAR